MTKSKKLFSAILLIFSAVQIQAQNLDDCSVYASVDFSVKLREWDGFGINYVQTASTYDFKARPQDYGGFSFLNEKQRQEILDMIFGAEGLQPSILKMFMDPLHQPLPGGDYDHATSTEWMRYFAREGIKRTMVRNEKLQVITTMYGPMSWATKQKSLNGRDLDISMFPYVADYMVHWIQWLKKTENIDVQYMSLFNEADKPYNWNMAGTEEPERIFDYNTFWKPTEVAEFMPLLRNKLDAAGLKQVGITPGECSSWMHFHTQMYDWCISQDSQALKSITIITSHSFGGPHWAIPQGIAHLRKYKPEIKAWVTSSGWGRNNMYMPEQVALNINRVKVNAFMPWAALQCASQWIDGIDPNPAPPFIIKENGTYEVTPSYYQYKHFTRAGRPGMAVCPVSTTSDTDIELVAFGKNQTKNPDALIVINKNDWASRNVAIKVIGGNSLRYKVIITAKLYGVTATHLYKDGGTVELQNGYIVYNIPAHALVSFIGE